MLAKLKTWLITIGTAVLVIVTLGTWALWERKAKQFQQRRADRAEKLAKARADLLDASENAQRRRYEIDKSEEAALDEISKRIQRVKERREKALRAARKPHKTPWEWFNNRFGEK
tara:strand:- start:283 stop:627 length:345 start_codon:yes stop_codon:yes gene_type:complete